MTRLFQVDAFTATPFSGNPAAVVLLERWPEDEWLRRVSAEMNLAETAFVLPERDGARPLRWFTPTVEVPLCGHATLATAHALWESGLEPDGAPLAFATRHSGQVTARRDGTHIVLDLPAYAVADKQPPDDVVALAGGAVRGAALVDDLAGDRTWLLELESEAAVRAFRADDSALLATGCGLVLTAAAAPGPGGVDVVSRCFFPGAGISEDPVTGAAHCALAPYWAPRLGRDELLGYQASPRGGFVRMRLAGDRVELRGQAVTVFTGELRG